MGPVKAVFFTKRRVAPRTLGKKPGYEGGVRPVV